MGYSLWKNTFTNREFVRSKPLLVTFAALLLTGFLLSSIYVKPAILSSGPSISFPRISWLPAFAYRSEVEKEFADVFAPVSHPQPTSAKSSSKFHPHRNAMPSLEAFKLTKELVDKRVKDNVIIVTFGNFAFRDFILTWSKHLVDMGLLNFLVGAMDTMLLEELYHKGIAVFDMGSHMNTADVGWGSPSFHKMGREKVILIDTILPFGYELLMCDTDMVWLKNPFPYLSQYPEADILISSDQVVPTGVDESLDTWQQVDAAYNIGIFHWRPTESSKKMAKEWRKNLLVDDKTWDQSVFNEIVRRQLGPSIDTDNGIFYAFDGDLKLGLLPPSIFCNGHTFFVQAMHQQFRLRPYAVHTTFQFAGTEGKRHRLREAMLFVDPPEYYEPSQGFLSFEPRISKGLLLDGEHTIDSHFTLVNYQIRQIRTALAIASLLNRILIMPPIWCRLDRLWFPHPGVIPRTMTRQPFICPLDHVFEVNVMLKNLSEEEFGPAIGIREYSFIDNPSLPEQVKRSRLHVQLCQEGSKDCPTSHNISQGILKLPKYRNEEELRTTFSTFKNTKIIHFSSLQDAFLGFTDKKVEDRFRKRVKRYVGLWCCVENSTIGHIYYDMYWDEKPGWVPKPPQTQLEDHPPV